MARCCTRTLRLVGRSRGNRSGSLDRDGIDSRAWAELRSLVEAVHSQDVEKFESIWLPYADAPSNEHAKVGVYAMAALRLVLVAALGEAPVEAAIAEYVGRATLGHFERINEGSGVDVVLLAATCVTGASKIPDDPERVGYMMVGAIIALGVLLPYPAADLNNRRAEVAHDLRLLPSDTPYLGLLQ